MDTEIRYRESSAQSFESTGAFLTADDVNELCRRWIEAERERTHALLTELLIQICDNTIPEVVSRLPELRGPAGPVGPAGKLPIVEEWTRETVFYEGSVVTYDGGSYQALRDTGEPPDNEAHWQCLAAPGRDAKSISPSRHVQRRCGVHRLRRGRAQRGVVSGPARQARSLSRSLDGNYSLRRASAASPARGPQGDRGPAGIAGPPGKDAATIVGWAMDRSAYTVTPVMSDGSSGSPLNLRGLFEQFVHETGR